MAADARPGLPSHVRALYPFESNFLGLDGGVRLHYLDEGRGEPVVMLHGNPTWSFYYRGLARGLRESYRVVVPDHVGCGLSDKPGDDRYTYTLRRRVDDLDTLLDHLGLTEGLTLVLHDWGGMIGMAYAHRHPTRVRQLVVLNTAAFRMPAGKRLPWSLWLCRHWALGPLVVRGLNGFSRAAVRWCAKKPLPRAVRDGYVHPHSAWHERVAVLRFVQDIPLEPADPSFALLCDVESGLGRFADLPTLVCWGQRDFVFDADFLEAWRGRFPRALVHTFPDAGHWVLEDEPDAVLDLVRDFLHQHSS
jgi:haloalkane dehalogenase